MYYPQTEFISSRNGFWLKEKLFALKVRFLSAISSVVRNLTPLFGRDNHQSERRLAERFREEKFRTTGVAHIVALSGYNITIVAETIMLFSVFAAVSGDKRGSNGRDFVCHNDRGFGYCVARFHYGFLALTARATGRIYTVSWALFWRDFLWFCRIRKF